jgi:hypothetical protein
MTFVPYPNTDDLQELADAHKDLATAGIAAGPEGYDVDTLAAAAYDQGWSYRIDRAAGVLGYRVEVRPQGGTTVQPLVSAVGWEPEVALAFALSQALIRRAQRTGRPLGARAESAEAVAAE